jgi:hypothetical protein
VQRPPTAELVLGPMLRYAGTVIDDPVRVAWPTFSTTTTMRSPTSAFIVSPFTHFANSPRLSLHVELD